tara:strand:- start:2361 stop:2591 length:231 start_codon:yes stop_codon:yes gene_type:complete
MNFKSYTEGTSAIYGDNPNENTQEAIECKICANNLDPEEIENQEEDTNICNECFYSCCNDELDQDNRICPTCREHN